MNDFGLENNLKIQLSNAQCVMPTGNNARQPSQHPMQQRTWDQSANRVC